MTKYNDKFVELLGRWFKTKTSLTRDEYGMLKDLCYLVFSIPKQDQDRR